MKNTTMDPRTDRQARLEISRMQAVEEYPILWKRIISEWHTPGDDRAWLMYAANYLFRMGEVHWALDPLSLRQRIPGAPEVDILHDLAPLSFVLLTHCHADHLDLELIRVLSTSPVLWVIPECLLEKVMVTGLQRDKIIVPRSMEPIHLYGITITPFKGLHWEDDPAYPDGHRGVPETSYLLEFNGKRWLFPGDIRTYNASQLPSFDAVDGVFSHLWLGRGCAQMDVPPLLEAFCRFYLDLQPKRVVVTHMNEFGREADDYWDESHFESVREWFQQYAVWIPVIAAYMGDSFHL